MILIFGDLRRHLLITDRPVHLFQLRHQVSQTIMLKLAQESLRDCGTRVRSDSLAKLIFVVK